MEPVSLRDAIRALRVEIMEAAEDASTQAVRFELGPIEMEFEVVAKRERGVEGKIGFYIFAADTSIGGSGKATNELTQKVKLSLNPVLVKLDGTRSELEIGRDKQSASSGSEESTLERP